MSRRKFEQRQRRKALKQQKAKQDAHELKEHVKEQIAEARKIFRKKRGLS